jgi:glycosyltransferase involved in cell wall biosynthesis
MPAEPPFVDKDYVSPGLKVVAPDRCFPRMRSGDRWSHPWKYLRREVPHIWYADERFPLMGFMNRDEATLLHNIALQFKGKAVLEIGSWLGWSTCHIALAGVDVDVIDPAHADPELRAIVEESLARCGVSGRVSLTAGRSPEDVHTLAATLGRKWSLFVVDGDHEDPAPLRDTAACLPYADEQCAFVFHDLASPSVAAALRFLEGQGFNVLVYQTAQIMGLAWRGDDISPVPHVPDPDVAWQLPHHLVGLPVSGVDFAAAHGGQAILPVKPNEAILPVKSGQAGLPVLHDRPFPDFDQATTTAFASVCIVSNEIMGPFKNGGIGTSMTGLAETLAAAGHRVTVLYTGNIWTPDSGLRRWQKHYAALGIELAALTLDDMRSITGPLKDCGFGAPWLVYQYLHANRFDVVHFNDCCGEGHLALAAKRLGLAFHETLLVVALHSPSQWVLELNQTLPADLLLTAYNYAERLSVRCADVLWSPSRYMLQWARQHEFILPRATFLQQYALPVQPLPDPVSYGAAPKPRTIVFFGRLEERKGLRLFCNAVDSLRGELAAREITVVFLGKEATVAGIHSLDYIASRSRRWRFNVKTITTFGQAEALAYLRAGEKLAVMPSPLDNSPCTVYEALGCGLPFLAARTGGIAELIHADDREKVLFDYSTQALRAALLRALDDGGWVGRPSIPQSETRQRWAAVHANWQAFLPTSGPGAPVRDVVAIVDHRSGMNLDATLRSLEACDGMRRVVILNRTGKRLFDHSPSLPVHDIDLLVEDAEALNEELATMRGDAVLLVHSGIVVRPEPFAAMRKALGCEGVDGVVPAARIIGGGPPRIMPSLGGSASFSLFQGLTFTGGLLVRGDALLTAKWKRPFAVESAFMGLADFCATRGSEIWPWPEAVFDRPEDYETEDRSALPARVAAYEDSSSIDRYYMLSTGYGAAAGVRSTGHKRRLALAIADLGFGTLLRFASWGLRRARKLRSLLRRNR